MPDIKKRQAMVLYNGKTAGILTKLAGRYQFQYDEDYLVSADSRPISMTLPLRLMAYESDLLFPAFVNMLSEGANKRMQCRMLKIDENDYFGLLLATAKDDNIGPVTIQEIYEPS